MASIEHIIVGLSDDSDEINIRTVSGKCFLYVGGMPHTANNIQKMAVKMGGTLKYYKGRNGKSEMSSLALSLYSVLLPWKKGKRAKGEGERERKR